MIVKAGKNAVRGLARQLPWPDAMTMIWRYRRHHGRMPNVLNPASFTEKVLHRILFDRRPVLSVMADKFAVRDYVRERIGAASLPALFHVTDDPSTIPFDDLPNSFVIKPTHGSGWVRVVKDKSTLDRNEIIRTCRQWLGQNYYDITREWAYRSVAPRIVVEELIDDGSGLAPIDYKFLVFDGRVRFIVAIKGRFEDMIHAVMTPSWEPAPASWSALGPRGEIDAPVHLREMIEAAERLAAGMDFVRVDFYDTPARPVFGEMTATPCGGTTRFEPLSFDTLLGNLWRVDLGAGRTSGWRRWLRSAEADNRIPIGGPLGEVAGIR